MPTLQMLNSTRFGTLEVPEEERMRLLRPMPGFPDTHGLVKVILPAQAPFIWLQSLEQPPVAFMALPVELLRADYALKLPPWDRGLWSRAASPEVLALVSFQEEATVNLAAPVLLDSKRRVALQVLNQGPYGLKERLVPQASADPMQGGRHAGAVTP